MMQLRDLGTWSGGNTPSKANVAYWTNGTVPWVSPKDMKVDEIVSSEDRITEVAVSDGRVSLIPEGSVLFVTRSGILSHTFPVAITKLPVTINQDLKALSPKAGISPKYVAHAVRGASQRILKQCSKHGTTVASVETNALLDFEIPIVGLDEQHRIVAEIEKQFSRLDEAVAGLRRVKANLKRYKAAVLKAAVEGRLVPTEADLARREGRSYETGAQLLHRILQTRRSQWQGKGKYKEPAAPNTADLPELPEGWAWATVEQLSLLVEYGSSAKTSEDSSGTPVFRMGNIVEGELILDELKYLPRQHDEFPKLLLEPGDLLFNRTNSPELVGKTAVFLGASQPYSFASYLIRVRLVEGCLPVYLNAYINSAYGRAWVRAVVTQQVGQANVNGTKLQVLSVPLPPCAEQHRIVAEVDRLLSIAREAEAEVDANLRRAQSLRQATLTNAFQEAPL
jgi:type I restriction enzyme, S subunit